MRDGWFETTLDRVTECSWGNTETTKSKYVESGYLAYSASGADGFLDWFEHDRTAVVLSAIGAQCGKTWFAEGQWTSIKNTIWLKSDNLNLLDKYLFYLSNRDQFWQIRGQAQPFISLGDVKKTKVLLPPLPDQKRIVDLVSSVDFYIDALQQQLESAKRSRNAVLHELLTVGGDDWEATTIGEISDFVSLRKSPKQLSSDSIYVGLEHLEPNNTSIDRFDSIRKVTSSLTPFEAGDVLFGRLRPYLHKVAIAEIFGFCSPEILVLRANAKVLPQMLLLYCDADSTIKICVERSAGTRMPRTSTEDLASIEIKLPPMPEQTKMAELFSAFDTEITETSIALEKTKVLRSGLLSDLLSGAHNIPVSYDNVVGAA